MVLTFFPKRGVRIMALMQLTKWRSGMDLSFVEAIQTAFWSAGLPYGCSANGRLWNHGGE